MKKFMFLIVLLLLPVMVYAEDYDVKTLIPVDTKVSVKTEKFDYNNFVYSSKVDDKGNGLITFESIKNNTVTKQPISINILLFDEGKKNIGFLTYCTDKDLDSGYSGYKLNGNGSANFSINVVSKYFVDNMSSKDVKYISVLDENKYCQIGGYDKYNGLTLEEIVNGPKKEVTGIEKLILDIQEKGIMSTIIFVLVGLIGLVILIMIISAILKKIKDNKYRKVKVDNTPIEDTVDLTYGEVKEETLDDDGVISMGEVSTTLEEENKEEDKKEEEENKDDLTSYFN